MAISKKHVFGLATMDEELWQGSSAGPGVFIGMGLWLGSIVELGAATDGHIHCSPGTLNSQQAMPCNFW